MSASKTTLKVASKTLQVSNLDKVFYPQCGFTKGEVIDYYIKVAPVLLPHLKNRPVSLKRYPDGVEGIFFYEKRCPAHAPSWIKTVKVPRTEGADIDYCMINDLPSLVWAANIANLEFHPFTHKAPAIAQPTSLVFDLDPGPPADIVQCCQVALWVKAILEGIRLQCFAKTSGSKGMQVVVPLNTPTTYEKTKALAHGVATTLEQRFPEAVVSQMQKNLRKGKVLVDWSQNDDKKTTVCVYSLRAKQEPTTSTPVTWEEVRKAHKTGNARLLTFDSKAVLKRIAKHGDLFAPVLTLKQKLVVASVSWSPPKRGLQP